MILDGLGFPAYLASLPKKYRDEAKRQLNRFRQTEDEILVGGVEVVDLRRVVALLRATAGRFGSEFFYPAETTEQFLRQLAGDVEYVALRRHDRMIASGIILKDGSTAHFWAAGIEYGDTPYSPYAVLLLSVIRRVLESGCSVLLTQDEVERIRL